MSRIALLEGLGRAITPTMVQGTIAAFAPQALRASSDLCTVQRNLAYGPNERQRLDLFQPLRRDVSRPIVMFVHGGGFVGGDKGAPEAPFYNNIGAWAVRQGFLGANMTYRLAPGHGWPAGSDDVAAGVSFLRAHCAEFGADPEALFVIGQSAGATHLAGYVAHAHYAAATSIAGAVFMSGMYELSEATQTPMQASYFGTDVSQFAERSTVLKLAETRIPCLFSIAELDPDNFQKQTGAVIAAYLAARGILPRLEYYSGHNHVSPALHIGADDDAVGPTISSFIRSVQVQ